MSVVGDRAAEQWVTRKTPRQASSEHLIRRYGSDLDRLAAYERGELRTPPEDVASPQLVASQRRAAALVSSGRSILMRAAAGKGKPTGLHDSQRTAAWRRAIPLRGREPMQLTP